MSMTVLVTRNVSNRMRGFLRSSMLELAPGVYSAPRMSPAVRERVWNVIEDWWHVEAEASVVMVWQDVASVSGQSVRMKGSPPVELVEIDGLIVTRRGPSPK